MKRIFFIIIIFIGCFLASCEKEGDIICTDKVWYRDCDKDGKGDPLNYIYSCKVQPAGFVANADDDVDLGCK